MDPYARGALPAARPSDRNAWARMKTQHPNALALLILLVLGEPRVAKSTTVRILGCHLGSPKSTIAIKPCYIPTCKRDHLGFVRHRKGGSGKRPATMARRPAWDCYMSWRLCTAFLCCQETPFKVACHTNKEMFRVLWSLGDHGWALLPRQLFSWQSFATCCLLIAEIVFIFFDKWTSVASLNTDPSDVSCQILHQMSVAQVWRLASQMDDDNIRLLEMFCSLLIHELVELKTYPYPSQLLHVWSMYLHSGDF